MKSGQDNSCTDQESYRARRRESNCLIQLADKNKEECLGKNWSADGVRITRLQGIVERRTSYFGLLTLQYGSDQSKEGEMDGACSMYVKCDKHIQNLGRENKSKFGEIWGTEKRMSEHVTMTWTGIILLNLRSSGGIL